MVYLDIITGFLGSGKTTLINRLLADAYQGEKPILIENEFGDVGIDDQLIADPDIQVRMLASGCVCCTLKGDFISGIREVVDQYAPARIVIEPTGLADPQDILQACEEATQAVPAEINTFVTIANARNLQSLLAVGGDIFQKQIAGARLLLLNRTDLLSPEKLAKARTLIKEINPDCLILEEGVEPLDALRILALAEESTKQLRELQLHEAHGGGAHEEGAHEAHHHHDGSHHHHDHHHHEESSFGAVASSVFYPERTFSTREIEELYAVFSKGDFGQILRAKGFLKTDAGGYTQIQYVYEQGETRDTPYTGSPKLVIIGSCLDKQALIQCLT